MSSPPSTTTTSTTTTAAASTTPPPAAAVAGGDGLPSLLVQAARTAAQADGLSVAAEPKPPASAGTAAFLASAVPARKPAPPTPTAPQKKKGPPLRRGKWTPEEEAYANRLILEFKAGLLPLTDGTTLRTFLSKLLNCDPMRISKKFVGSNCIGKQVFRRRTGDINRLTPEQIQQSRAELSELERRFLERVAQTNRVKSSSGVVGEKKDFGLMQQHHHHAGVGGGNEKPSPPSPPWLQPPLQYKQGNGAAMAAAAAANNRAAAAGRALLSGHPSLAELQRSLSNSALHQIARNASAARLANPVSSLMAKTGLSRDQLTQLAARASSSSSLNNMMERQSSFDALMSLDLQSLQSIDNLANLIQTTGQQQQQQDMKNWSAETSNSNSMRRLASAGRMESLLRSLSSGNVHASQPNLFGAANAASALSLASMLRPDSSTGLTALRMQDGLVQRNSSVDDFLSLVASGDIPHQDPTLLNVPLLQQQQQQQSNAQAAAQYLAQQQLLAQAAAANSGNAALSSALRGAGSLSNLRSNLSQRAAALGLESSNKRKSSQDGGGASNKKSKP